MSKLLSLALIGIILEIQSANSRSPYWGLRKRHRGGGASKTEGKGKDPLFYLPPPGGYEPRGIIGGSYLLGLQTRRRGGGASKTEGKGKDAIFIRPPQGGYGPRYQSRYFIDFPGIRSQLFYLGDNGVGGMGISENFMDWNGFRRTFVVPETNIPGLNYYVN